MYCRFVRVTWRRFLSDCVAGSVMWVFHLEFGLTKLPTVIGHWVVVQLWTRNLTQRWIRRPTDPLTVRTQVSRRFAEARAGSSFIYRSDCDARVWSDSSKGPKLTPPLSGTDAYGATACDCSCYNWLQRCSISDGPGMSASTKMFPLCLHRHLLQSSCLVYLALAFFAVTNRFCDRVP